jgi:hypothetical protein
MSEDKTKEAKDARSFEERVFARFDSGMNASIDLNCFAAGSTA